MSLLKELSQGLVVMAKSIDKLVSAEENKKSSRKNLDKLKNRRGKDVIERNNSSKINRTKTIEVEEVSYNSSDSEFPDLYERDFNVDISTEDYRKSELIMRIKNIEVELALVNENLRKYFRVDKKEYMWNMERYHVLINKKSQAKLELEKLNNR